MNLPQTAPSGQPLLYRFLHQRTGLQLLDNQCLSNVNIQQGEVLQLLPTVTGAGNALTTGPTISEISDSPVPNSNLEASIPMSSNPGPSNSGPSADGNSDAAVWYVAKSDGQREGPLALSVLKDRVAAGKLLPTDLLWKQGFTSWTPARGVPELYGTSSGATPGPAT